MLIGIARFLPETNRNELSKKVERPPEKIGEFQVVKTAKFEFLLKDELTRLRAEDRRFRYRYVAVKEG